MATLATLAPELTLTILSHLDLPSLFSLSVVSKRLSSIATDELRFCRKYLAVSDQHPATVPSVLRDILNGNARVARCVQAIEIYGCRRGWGDWKADGYGLVVPEGYVGLTGDEAGGYGEGFFEEGELQRFYYVMVDELRLGVEEAVKWRDRIKEGDDAALKVLLIALCPGLRAVRFVQNAELRGEQDGRYVIAVGPRDPPPPPRLSKDTPADEHDDSGPEEEREDARSVLASVITRIFATEDKKWPPGLLSLEDLALGVKSKSSPAPPDCVAGSSSAKIATTVAVRFFCLPNLKTVYIHGLTRSFPLYRDEEESYAWGPTEACSSVKDILFDAPNEPELGALRAMFGSSARTLRSIIFHGGTVEDSFDLDNIFSGLEHEWKDLVGPDGSRRSTLQHKPETVLFCGTEVHGYRSTMYYAEDVNVHVATMDTEDIWRDFEPHLDEPEKKTEEEAWRNDFRYCFGFERIVVVNGTFEAKYEPLIDEQLAKMIRDDAGEWTDEELGGGDGEDSEEGEDGDEGEGDEEKETGEGETSGAEEEEGKGEINGEEESGNKDGDDENTEDDKKDAFGLGLEDWGVLTGDEPRTNYRESFPNLGFYLTSLDEEPEERTYRWWSKTIAAGRRNGIPVHTRTTKPPKRNEEYGFHVQWPEGVSDNLLETSPWHGHPSLPKVYFKPHVGFVDDCEHCGECEECFECYPPEVWAAIKKEDEEAAAAMEDEGSDEDMD